MWEMTPDERIRQVEEAERVVSVRVTYTVAPMRLLAKGYSINYGGPHRRGLFDFS